MVTVNFDNGTVDLNGSASDAVSSPISSSGKPVVDFDTGTVNYGISPQPSVSISKPQTAPIASADHPIVTSGPNENISPEIKQAVDSLAPTFSNQKSGNGIVNAIKSFNFQDAANIVKNTGHPLFGSLISGISKILGQKPNPTDQDLANMESELAISSKDIDSHQQALQSYKSDLNATKPDLSDSDAVVAYNAKIDAYNAQAQDLQDKVNSYNQTYAEYQKGSKPTVFGGNESLVKRASAIASLPQDIIKGFVNNIASPDPDELNYEHEMLATAHANPVNKVVAFLPENAIFKPVVRTLYPIFKGIAEDIGQQIAAKPYETSSKGNFGNLNDFVNQKNVDRHIADPSKGLSQEDFNKAFPALAKTNLQKIGDGIQAALGVAAPEFFEGKTAGAIAGNLSTLGTLFGGSQILSSGTKDPAEMAQILTSNVLGTMMLGFAFHGAGPTGGAAFDALTKNITKEWGLPENVIISAEDLADLQSGKALYEGRQVLNPQEQKTFNEWLAKIPDARDQMTNSLREGKGLTINIPSYEIVKIIDKPWWSKVKSLFNVESVPETRGSKAYQSSAVKGYLPSPAESITPEGLADLAETTKAEGYILRPQESIPEEEPVNETEKPEPEAIQEKLPEGYSKAVDAYKQVGLTDTSKGTGALDDLLQEASSDEGKKYISGQVNKIPKNDDGTITVFRVGNVRDGTMSVTTSQETSQVLAKERSSQGLSDTVTEMRIQPENIKAVVPGFENELVVENPGELPEGSREKNPVEEKKEPSSFNTKGMQSGFIDPAGIVRDIKSKIEAVNTLINETQKKSAISSDVKDDLFKLINARRANEQRLINFINENAENLTPNQQIAITSYDEDKSEPLTSEEKDLYDNYVKPLKDAVQLMRARMKEFGVSLHDIEGEYTPHYVVGKNNPAERLSKNAKEGRKSTGSGGPLKKSVGDKHRTMRILTDENGNRTVVSVDTIPYKITKGKRAGDVVSSRRVTAFRNGQPEDLGVFKLKARGALMDQEIQPLQRRLERLQRTASIISSIKTREPVSEIKLNNLKKRADELKSFLESERNEPEQPKDNAFVKIRNSIEKEIDGLNAKISDLETKEKTLAPYEKTNEKIASDLEKIQDRLSELYEKESNLSLSDIYEQLSEMTDRIEKASDEESATDEKEVMSAKKKLSVTLHDIKVLSNVRNAEDVVLRSRRLANINSKVTSLVNQISDIESKYDQEALDQKVFVGADGKTYRIGEATIKEIEANTNLKYSKNPIVNWALAYQQTLRAYMANNWLEEFKSSPEFNKIAVKEGEAEIPDGWKQTKLPQFRGYYFEPRTAEVFDDFDKRLNNQDRHPLLAIYDQINRTILTLTLINPIAHTLNVTANYIPERGLHLLDPRNYKTTMSSFAKAWNAVKIKNEDYLKMLEIGAPLQGLKETTSRLAEILLDHYSDIAVKDENFADAVNNKIGDIWNDVKSMLKNIPKNLHGAAFFGGDLLMMQSIYQEAELRGISFEEAIKNVSKYQADYRMPSRIGDTALTAIAGERIGGGISRGIAQILSSNEVLAFSSYHLSGLVKPWVNAVADGLNPDFKERPLNDPDRIKAWSVALLAVLLLIGKNEVQKELRKITKNPNLYIKAPGMVGALDDLIALFEGKESAGKFISHFVTLAPGLKLVDQILANKDIYTGEPIFGDLGEGLKEFALSSISTVGDLRRFSQGDLSLQDYALSQFGIHNPSSTIETTTQRRIMNIAQVRNVGEFAGTDQTPSSSLLSDIRREWQAGNSGEVRKDLTQAKTLGYLDNFDISGIDFKTATDDQLQKFFKDNEDALKADVPPDVRAFAALAAPDQKLIMDKMSYEELMKYGWYAAKPGDVQGTSAEDEFAKAANADAVKKPEWIRGQIPAPEQEAMAKEGKKPTFPENSLTSSGSIISTALLYAKAIGTDPITAFNRIFTGQKITKVDNGVVFVERMSLSASEKDRRVDAEDMGLKSASGYNLDHAVPLEAGGDNSKDNLQLIPESQWEANTPVENYLAKALKDGNITGKQVREYAIRFKAGNGESLTPKLQEEYKGKYDSQPITFDQIKQEIEAK